MQPNPQAPLLRNERMRREWIEKELDLCNQVGDGGDLMEREGLSEAGQSAR